MKITHYPEPKDIDKCENEPIHLIPKIQSHGCLLVLNEGLKVIQASSNVHSILGFLHGDILGKSIDCILNLKDFEKFQIWHSNPIDHDSFEINLDKSLIVIPHLSDGCVLLDIEPIEELWNAVKFQQRMLALLNQLHKEIDVAGLTQAAARSVKELLGYDRVMIYKFDENWNGEIIAESKEESLTSWLGLHYPAGDIPENARNLFLKQGVRVLTDINDNYAHLEPAINPSTNSLLQVGKSHLRGSSPIHIEYLKNMKVGATLNCAIVNNGKLWGLIACHHYSPKLINFQKRQSCQIMSELIANQINLKSSKFFIDHIERTSKVRSQLVTNMSLNWDIIAGLTMYEVNATSLINNSSFAVIFEGEISTLGKLPQKEIIKNLSLFLSEKTDVKKYYLTDSISKELPWMEAYAALISSVLYYPLSNKKGDALLWFRPEQKSIVNWGGNPEKSSLDNKNSVRLSPRKSFEKWSKEVSFTGIPWKDFEIKSAKALVDDVKNIIVTKFTEISDLNRQLINLNEELESFSYSVSHDLRGPLRGIDGFAQILKEDYLEVLDDYGKNSLDIIINSAKKMNDLMDDILGYSGLGKATKIDDYHDVNLLCEEIIKDNEIEKFYSNTQVVIQKDIPAILGDKAMIYQLFGNLITNAFKYSSKVNSPKVEIGFEMDGEQVVYFVKDNGIGFKDEYSKKIFGVFTRLVKDEFKGTGVGLAIAQRVVLRHHGDIWAESKLGHGATFKFFVQNK